MISLLTDKIKNLAARRYKVQECETDDKDCMSGVCGIIVAALLVFFMVATIVFSVYEVVKITGISNLANVHVTASLQNAAAEMLNGKMETVAGYEGWMLYGNGSYNFRYPADWQMHHGEGDSCLLRKYSKRDRQGFDSLDATIAINANVVADNLSIKEIAAKKGIIWNDGWQQQMIGGKPGIRTGLIKAESGVQKEFIFWKLNNKIYSIEIDYLNEDIAEIINTFDKIIAQFEFK